MDGHLFLALADLHGIDCDAVLIPTDDELQVTSSFGAAVNLPGGGHLDPGSLRGAGKVLELEFDRGEEDRVVFVGKIGEVECRTEAHAKALAHRLGHAVETFVAKAASSQAVRSRARHHQRKVPRLALPLVGTGEGGLGRFPGQMVHLLDRLASAASEHRCDVVLCVVDERQWSAAQRARRVNDARHWSMARHDEQLAQTIADHARSGSLVLFVGAGVSRDAGLPDWRGLLRALAVESDLLGTGGAGAEPDMTAFESLDPRDAASLVERHLARVSDGSVSAGLSGRSALLSALEAKVGAVTRFGLTHALLASLPVKEVVTTNFDQLFEAAWRRPGGPSASVIPYEPVEPNGRWILKLHGSLSNGINGDDGRADDIVLTRSDYVAQTRLRGALLGIVQAMLATRHLLFVGYSLSDDDFHLLSEEIRSALGGSVQQRGTVITLGEPLWRDLWADLFDVVALKGRSDSAQARRLQLILDRAASLAAPQYADLLAQGYELNEEEKRARSALRRLRTVADGAESDELRAVLRRALSEFGDE